MRVPVLARAEDRHDLVEWRESGSRAFDPAELDREPETFRDAFYRGDDDEQ